MTQRFAIFYADGSVYEGGGPDDALVPIIVHVSRDWLDAPADGVLFVAVDEDRTKNVVLQGADFYFPVTDGEGYGFSDHLGAWLRGNLPGFVKFGEYVSGRRFVDVLQSVKARRDG